MPKFYHTKKNGFNCVARAVGWRRILPFNFFPYLTGDIIRIHISLTSLLKGQEYQTGILEVEPPELSRESPQIRLSDSVFSLIDFPDSTKVKSIEPAYKFPRGTEWSRIIALKDGLDFFQPCHIKCTLVLQNIIGDKRVQSAGMPIANIEIVSRPSFYGAVITALLSIIAIIISIIAIA